MEQDIAQYYAGRNPGQVQVLGVDLWNGSAAQLGNFKGVTGATYPLLLNGASPTGGNVEALYGTYDNYIVLSRQGVVRYHAALVWPHGDRYHLDEIRGSVDSLVTSDVGVPPAPGGQISLSASPNPARDGTRVELSLPASAGEADVSVLDLAGRLRATLHRGPLGSGRHVLRWDARDAGGAPVAAGIYLVQARLDRVTRVLRVAVIR